MISALSHCHRIWPFNGLPTAMFVSFVALVSPVASFMAVRTEVLDGLMIAHLGIVDASIALVPRIGFCRGRSREQNPAECQGRQCGLAEK
jgi:hypothetical protein